MEYGEKIKKKTENIGRNTERNVKMRNTHCKTENVGRNTEKNIKKEKCQL
jgi:hypothetical protein